MSRLLRYVMPLALTLAALALGSCELSTTAPDRTVTCNAFAKFQQDCTSTCSVTWSCESNYDSLSVDDQITLDDCADCLEGNLANGTCGDCHDKYVGSCRQFMEDLLHVKCW
jgi:hypothetical protein